MIRKSDAGVIVYDWPNFRLEFDPGAGTAYTHYQDGTRTGCGLVPEDSLHAEYLEITPELHRFAHELAHHVVAHAIGRTCPAGGCPILWRDAHREPQPFEAAVDEWRITAFTYYAFGKNMRHAFEWAALHEMHLMGADIAGAADRYRKAVQWASRSDSASG